jgi:protein CpxP
MGALGPVIAHLDLTDAQKDQVKGIMDSHRDELKGFGDRAMTARQALQSAVVADALNEGLIRARAAELATVESDLAVAHARIHAEVFRILTPEQQVKAKEAQAQMVQRQNHRRDRTQVHQPRGQ